MLNTICPNCGVATDNSTHCPSCGKSLPAADVTAPVVKSNRITMLLAITGALVVFCALFIPAYLKSVDKKYTACIGNCIEMELALKAYSIAHQGKYPRTLQELATSGYITLIPTCPQARRDTYSGSYTVNSSLTACTFCCKGNNHFPAMKGNYPYYTSKTGVDFGR